MRKIILLKGLPASGKSTYAKSLVDQHPGKYKIVNKDQLRAMLDNGKWSKGNESFVLRLRDYIVTVTIQYGQDIIVDDTNLHQKHFDRMVEIAKDLTAKGIKVEVEIKDFTDLSLEECIKRDQKRQNYVGEKVIREMYNRYLRPKPPVIELTPFLPDCIIVDLDGTLALFGNANPYNRDFLNDQVNSSLQRILDWKGVAEQNEHVRKCDIILFSGRMDKFRGQTEQWLGRHTIAYNALHMRKTDDLRKDSVIKKELYEAHVKGKYNVIAVFDDRLSVARLWHELGLPLFRVGDPDADF